MYDGSRAEMNCIERPENYSRSSYDAHTRRLIFDFNNRTHIPVAFQFMTIELSIRQTNQLDQMANEVTKNVSVCTIERTDADGAGAGNGGDEELDKLHTAQSQQHNHTPKEWKSIDKGNEEDRQ